MKTINSLISVIVLIVMLASPQMNVSAADVLTWENRQDMPTARYSMGAAVSNNKIYVIGGDKWSCTPLTNVEEYDPGTNTWSIREDMPTGRWSLGVATGQDGKIFAMGGVGGSCGSDILDEVEVYDPSTDSWETRTSMPTLRARFGMAAATNGKIYVFGGEDSNTWFSTVEEYDPATDTWTRKGDMPYPNKSMAVTAANNGKIYLLGGDAIAEALLEYDPETDSWASRATAPTSRYGVKISQGSDGRIYAIGGVSLSDEFLSTVESYDTLTDTWRSETGLQKPRSGHVAVSVDQFIYAIGGGWRDQDGNFGPISSVEAGTLIPIPAPANDNFTEATLVTMLPFSDVVDISSATTEPDEPSYCAYSPQTIWYKLTPTADATIQVNVEGNGFNTVLTFYQQTGPGFGGLSEINCIVDGRSQNFRVQAGETYYIQAGSTSTASGELHLSLEEISPPANDDFENPTVISSPLPYDDTVDITNTSLQANEPKPSSCAWYGSLWKTVWYAYTPETSGTISVSVSSAPFAPVLTAYTGNSLTGLTELSCQTFTGSALTLEVEAGTTYYFQVGKLTWWDADGPMQFNLHTPNPPANDNFANAMAIGTLPFTDSVNITDASLEPNEAQNCTTASRTVWYSFTPTSTMIVQSDVAGSDFGDTAFSIYQAVGPGITDLSLIQCASYGGTIRFTAEAGTTYYVQAGSVGSGGILQLQLQEILRPVNDDFINSQNVEALPYNNTVDITNATVEPYEFQACYYAYQTVWYSFTPTTNMLVQADTFGSSISDTIINVYRANGPAMENLSFMQCAYFGNPNKFIAEAGVTYYVQAGSIYGSGGSLQLNLQAIQRPSNDDIIDAKTVEALPYSDTEDISNATIQPGELQSCYYAYQTVWYSFTPTTNMLVQADMFGSSFYDTIFNVYQANGPGMENLSFMQCAYFGNSLKFNAKAGVTYYIQAGSIYSSGGSLHLNLQELIRPANDDFTNAKDVEALAFSDSTDISNATLEPGEQMGCYSSSQTVWYSFTPSANTLIQVDTSGSSFYDSFFNFYQAYGPDIRDMNHMYCSAFGNPLTFMVQAGETYYIQAGSMYGSSGTLKLNIQELPRPANDDFANAKAVLTIPFDDTVDTKYATGEINESIPSCAYNTITPITHTIWYAFTPTESGSISASVLGTPFTPIIAAYTGSSLSNLTQVWCGGYDRNILTIHVNAGTTYYFQVGNYYNWEAGGTANFHVELAPQPVAGFYYSPQDPTIYDTVQFCDSSYDPGWAPIQFYDWDFGDGATTSAITCPSHQYAKDGDYTVQLAITTIDGRKATTTQMVHVRTRDVAITKLSAPQSASAGQTRTITVSVNSKTYQETVQVDLYRSGPGGFVLVKSITQNVPAYNANRTVAYNFNYTFTSSDASIGKVTFYAVATIVNGRDSYPADNEAYSIPTKVNKRK
jgi:N-acetylneuraminic acid mutarotase/PKD repeat protein